MLSSEFEDGITYDSRTNDDGVLCRLTNDIIGLWLNNCHYDLVLSFRKFMKISMRYFVDKDDHQCLVPVMCNVCYSIHGNDYDSMDVVRCPICGVTCKGSFCLKSHYSNKIFKDKQGHLVSPCWKYMYFDVCKCVVDRFFVRKKKYFMHSCDNVYCDFCGV